MGLKGGLLPGAAQFKEYLQRAEAIKQMLDNVDSTANSQAKGTGAGATATKAKPKGQGVNEVRSAPA